MIWTHYELTLNWIPCGFSQTLQLSYAFLIFCFTVVSGTDGMALYFPLFNVNLVNPAHNSSLLRYFWILFLSSNLLTILLGFMSSINLDSTVFVSLFKTLIKNPEEDKARDRVITRNLLPDSQKFINQKLLVTVIKLITDSLH